MTSFITESTKKASDEVFDDVKENINDQTEKINAICTYRFRDRAYLEPLDSGLESFLLNRTLLVQAEALLCLTV